MLSGRKGFSLIELTLVIATGMVISFLSFQKMLMDHESGQSRMAGQQIKKVANAANNYIVNHFDKLSTLSNADGSSVDPGPRTCSVTNQTCTITVQTLINENFLPLSYTGRNVFGAGYTITLKRSGSSPYYNISGLVLTDQSLSTVSNTTTIRYDLLGKAMQEAGIDSGMTRFSPTIMEGFKGSWNATAADYSLINRQGLLGHSLGYGTNSYAVFLRRDGTLPMTGSLNMGGNDIVNAKNVNASGAGNFGANVTARNGYGDTISLGGDALSNDYELRLGSIKPLTVYSAGLSATDKLTTTILNVQGQVNIVGNQIVNKNIMANGFDSTDIPTGLSGIRANDVISSGRIMTLKPGTTGDNSVVSTYMDKDGYIYSSGNITAGREIYSGSWVWAKNNPGDMIGLGGDESGDYELKLMTKDKYLTIWWPEYFGRSEDYKDKMIFQTWGGISADGFIKASGNIQSSGNISATGTVSGQVIQATSTVSLNAACGATGAISKLSDGSMAACINGVWSNGFRQGKQRSGGMVFPNNMKMIWGTTFVNYTQLKDSQIKEGSITITPSFIDDNGNTIVMSNVLSAQVSPYDVIDLLGNSGLEGARLNSISGNNFRFSVQAKDIANLGMYAEWLAIGF